MNPRANPRSWQWGFTIRECLAVLKTSGFGGAVSLECDAGGDPILERSLKWFGNLLDQLAYANGLTPAVTKDE